MEIKLAKGTLRVAGNVDLVLLRAAIECLVGWSGCQQGHGSGSHLCCGSKPHNTLRPSPWSWQNLRAWRDLGEAQVLGAIRAA